MNKIIKQISILIIAIFIMDSVSACSKNRTLKDCGTQIFSENGLVPHTTKILKTNRITGRPITSIKTAFFAKVVSDDEQYEFYLRLSKVGDCSAGSEMEIRVLQDTDTGEYFFIDSDVAEADYNSAINDVSYYRVTELP